MIMQEGRTNMYRVAARTVCFVAGLAMLLLVTEGGSAGRTQLRPTATAPRNRPTATRSPYACNSSLDFGSVEKADSKGLCMDDTTFSTCPWSVPHTWPNTKAPIKILRLFAAWKEAWPAENREDAWNALDAWLRQTDGKILLGSEVSCDDNDEQMWKWAIELMQRVGPERLLGVAIGNEIDLLNKKEKKLVSTECLERLWINEGFQNDFIRRIDEMDALGGGFEHVPVMTVWSTVTYEEFPFTQKPTAKTLSFMQAMVERYHTRFVFAFNFYPYFEPTNSMDSGGQTCDNTIKRNGCFGEECFVSMMARSARKRIANMTNNSDGYTLIVGESGWSWPTSGTTQWWMARCKEWSSVETFRNFYKSFLGWELDGDQPPDYSFFFTMRDAFNFGVEEHFGLISSCTSTDCKL